MTPIKKITIPIEHTPTPHQRSYLNINMTEKENKERGKLLRQSVSLTDQSFWKVTRPRQDPIRILAEQAKTRIPTLIPLRHQRMSASPFAFFRGGAAIMAADLAKTPYTNLHVQLCGDMHVANFGFFATTEHHLAFGINDFDETLPGSWEWDLKRLVASAVIACESLGTNKTYSEDIVRTIVFSYRENMANYAKLPYIVLANQYLDDAQLRMSAQRYGKSAQNFLQKQIDLAQNSTNQSFLHKFTKNTNGRRRIIDQPPLITHSNVDHLGIPIEPLLDEAILTYADSLLSDRRQLLKRYVIQDFARKIVGVGSVGTSCWVLYMQGLNNQDPLFLQYKEAQKSVLAPYFGDPAFNHQGRRVVAGRRMLQGAPDILLGYGQAKNIDYYIRQLRDMKGGISIGSDECGKKELPAFAYLFGWALALGHARSGNPSILSGYLGKSNQIDDALVDFSFAYAQQNAIDFETFTKAIKQGKLPCAK